MKSIPAFSLVLALAAGTGLCRAAEPGVSDKQIKLGSSLALDGPAGFLGTQIIHGMDAYIKSVNEGGGVNGRVVSVVGYNDGYEPEPCLRNTQKLIENDKVFALTNYVGTPTSLKAMPVWTAAKVPALGFFTGAEGLRTPFNRYNVHVRASYYEEAAAIIDVFVNKLKFKKIAVFYQNDAFGEAVKKGTELALQNYGMAPVAYGTFERNTLAVADGLAKILPSRPDAIVMVGTYSPLAAFVKEAKKAGLARTLFHTVSFVGPEAFAREVGSDAAKCVITTVMPPYNGSNLPLITEYKTALAKHYPLDLPNFVSLEGFVNAKVLVEGLRRAGKAPTREGLIAAVESMDPFDLGGLSVNYGPGNHVGLHRVWFTRIRNGELVEVGDWSKL
jgi:branched-chain amino acid transport system substrate-binding protein